VPHTKNIEKSIHCPQRTFTYLARGVVVVVVDGGVVLVVVPAPPAPAVGPPHLLLLPLPLGLENTWGIEQRGVATIGVCSSWKELQTASLRAVVCVGKQSGGGV
jgi:hypothetical protein